MYELEFTRLIKKYNINIAPSNHAYRLLTFLFSDQQLKDIAENAPHCTHLDLSDVVLADTKATTLRDEDLKIILGWMQYNTSITSIDLSNSSISDITPLLSFPLKRINLSGNTNITAKDALKLTNHPTLESLDLSGCYLYASPNNNDQLRDLINALKNNTRLTSLKMMDFGRFDFINQGLLEVNTTLRSLALNAANEISRIVIPPTPNLQSLGLTNNTTLTNLEVTNYSLNRANIEAAIQHTSLRSLHVGHFAEINNPTFLSTFTRHATHLTHFGTSSNITSATFSTLLNTTNLSSINVGGLWVDRKEEALIADRLIKATHLTGLTICISYDNVKAFACPPSLTQLTTNVLPKKVKVDLANSTTLKELTLNDTETENKTSLLDALQRNTTLTSLTIEMVANECNQKATQSLMSTNTTLKTLKIKNAYSDQVWAGMVLQSKINKKLYDRQHPTLFKPTATQPNNATRELTLERNGLRRRTN